MKINWKRLRWWGGGFLLGGAAYLALRRPAAPGEAAEVLPEGVITLVVTTQPIDLLYRETPYKTYTLYRCQRTKFKVWSLLSAGAPGRAGQPPATIFHVTPEIYFVPVRSDSTASEEVVREEPFYATVRVHSPRAALAPNTIQRNGHIEFRKCHVGGSLNGVETGETVVTLSPVEDYSYRVENLQ